jgi:hypothetical protein
MEGPGLARKEDNVEVALAVDVELAVEVALDIVASSMPNVAGGVGAKALDELEEPVVDVGKVVVETSEIAA